MRMLLVAAAMTCAAADALAMSTYNPTTMACADVKATIRVEGQVMLRWMSPTTPGVERYGRYVRDSSFCLTGERAKDTLVPAADRDSCRVALCRPHFPGEDGFF